MNIGIDARILSNKMTGINRYLWNLLKYIPLFDKTNKYYLYAYDDVNYRNEFYNYTTTKRSRLPRQVYEHYWLNFVLPRYLKEQKIDIFFTPYILVPLKRGSNKNIIVIHDVMTKACPRYFTSYYKKYMDVIVPQAIKRADAVLTISESSRQDILKYYDISPENVQYMYLWADEKYKPISFTKAEKEDLLNKFGLPEKFILFVGAIEERKNIKGVLKISDLLVSKGIDIKFVLAGKESFGFRELYEEIKKRRDRVIYLNYIDEHSLPLLYNLAAIFLFPSFYEGFGLPPLEAMKCGIPVLSSNNSSLIEVVGQGGLQFDADDYESFTSNIVSLLNDDKFYTSLKSRALEQAKNFTPVSQIPKLINLFNKFNNVSNISIA